MDQQTIINLSSPCVAWVASKDKTNASATGVEKSDGRGERANARYYLRKSESALKWSILWLVAATVCGFLAVIYLRGESEELPGFICSFFALSSAIGSAFKGAEASRYHAKHISRTRN